MALITLFVTQPLRWYRISPFQGLFKLKKQTRFMIPVSSEHNNPAAGKPDAYI
jgi:hypothetical protein